MTWFQSLVSTTFVETFFLDLSTKWYKSTGEQANNIKEQFSWFIRPFSLLNNHWFVMPSVCTTYPLVLLALLVGYLRNLHCKAIVHDKQNSSSSTHQCIIVIQKMFLNLKFSYWISLTSWWSQNVETKIKQRYLPIS